MSDDDFDVLSRAAGRGMSRRRLLKLLLGSAAGAGIGAGALGPARAGAGAEPRVRAQAGGGLAGIACAVLGNLAAALNGVPFVGAIFGALLASLGCSMSGSGPTTTTTTGSCAPEDGAAQQAAGAAPAAATAACPKLCRSVKLTRGDEPVFGYVRATGLRGTADLAEKRAKENFDKRYPTAADIEKALDAECRKVDGPCREGAGCVDGRTCKGIAGADIKENSFASPTGDPNQFVGTYEKYAQCFCACQQ